jgi:hypothetical protein
MIMASDTRTADPDTVEPPQLPAEWQERARRAAEKFKLPVPGQEEIGSAEQLETRLRQTEQEDGQ